MEKRNIQKVGIIVKRNFKKHLPLLQEVHKHLTKRGKKVLFDWNSAHLMKKGEGLKKEDMMKRADLVIAMGGDGTLLKTARRVSYKEVPVLGVNLGNLGFLSEVGPDHMFDRLERIWNDRYVLDERVLLRVTVYRGDQKIFTSLALNDAVINQGAFARLVHLRTEINQRKVNDFGADGLIVATPTGSTGHSISAGGPIVHPSLDAFVVTPICPASLSNRPIIIPNDRQLKVILLTDRGDVGLTLDGQESISLEYKDEIKIRRSTRKFLMVRKTGTNYYKVLRDKLGWGT